MIKIQVRSDFHSKTKSLDFLKNKKSSPTNIMYIVYYYMQYKCCKRAPVPNLSPIYSLYSQNTPHPFSLLEIKKFKLQDTGRLVVWISFMFVKAYLEMLLFEVFSRSSG